MKEITITKDNGTTHRLINGDFFKVTDIKVDMVVTERVQKEIPLPLYLCIDENEYLHIDENKMCCYMYTDGDDQYHFPLVELYQYDYCLLEPSKRTYIDRWLKRYEDHICSKEEFEMFKKSLVAEL